MIAKAVGLKERILAGLTVSVPTTRPLARATSPRIRSGRFDDDYLTACARMAAFLKSMERDPVRFEGERDRPRVLRVRFQGISGHDIGRFKETPRHTVVSPPQPPSGRLVFPVRKRWKQSGPYSRTT